MASTRNGPLAELRCLSCRLVRWSSEASQAALPGRGSRDEEGVEPTVLCVQDRVAKLHQWMDRLDLPTKDLEDRSLENNIRIIGLSEKLDGPDMVS
ncbi:hypothetical protein NDU88_001021 [Pleurodeles waltl]|uniref:Uncharacterized protein n=1 Tax=Pleurodeles waltl TaxID=8319 RepID=A0AAV7URM3_PLEWA|nr:hypothetical protein NDU88_001021 [Pleurodeles waltl]